MVTHEDPFSKFQRSIDRAVAQLREATTDTNLDVEQINFLLTVLREQAPSAQREATAATLIRQLERYGVIEYAWSRNTWYHILRLCRATRLVIRRKSAPSAL